MQRIPCYMEYDEVTTTVTMRHAKTNTIQLMLKLDCSGLGTMTRIVPDEDCDNFWLGVKPTDRLVFVDELYGRSKLVVKSIHFDLV